VSACVVIFTVPFALRTCTVAPAMTAPDASTTVPDSRVIPWAFALTHKEAVEQNRTIKTTKHECSRPVECLDGITSPTYDSQMRVTGQGSVYHVS
jgi:hypothetical protein